MASFREGPNIDIVGRFVRRTILNEHLTLPIAAAATYLSLDASKLQAYLNLSLSPAVAAKAGRVALALGAAGFLLSLNEWLNKWYANNWIATKPGEWNWDREIVVVTGASGGLGASIVQHLLAKNPRTTIVIIDFVPLSWTPPAGSNVHYYQADLSIPAVIKDVCEKVRADVGHPTVLVNNAGLARGYTVMEGAYSDVEVTLKTNLIAPFLLVKEFMPSMVKNNHGHIVSICSMSSVVAPPGIVDYSASKNGILSLHEGLQVELRYRHNAPNVRLTNGVFNFIRTPLFTGDTGIPHFFAPLLHVDTVGESIVDTLYSGYGRSIYLPGIMRYVSMLRGGPEWMLRVLRNSSSKYGTDFKGRQGVSETGGLVPKP